MKALFFLLIFTQLTYANQSRRESVAALAQNTILSCPEFTDAAIQTCFGTELVAPITEAEFTDFENIVKRGNEPFAQNLRSSLVNQTLNQIKNHENILRTLYPELSSFDSREDFNCKEQTRDNNPAVAPDDIKDIQKAQLLRNQINGALLAEIVFTHKERVEDQIRSTIGRTASVAYNSCRSEGLGYEICLSREAQSTVPIGQELEEKMEKFEQIESQLFQRYPMLFNTTNEESGIILPTLELSRSDYQRQIISKIPSVDVSGIEFNVDNGIAEVDQLLTNIDSRQAFRDLINRSLIDQNSGNPSENYNDLLNEATPLAVENHLNSLAEAADNICDNPERLHHSDALIQLQIEALRNNSDNIEEFRERFYELQVGYCELLDQTPKEAGFLTTRTIAGSALVAGGVIAQLVPVAGTAAGAAAIFAGSAVLFSESASNFLNAREDEAIYLGLNAIGAEDYSAIRDAIQTQRVEAAAIGAELVFSAAGGLTQIARAARTGGRSPLNLRALRRSNEAPGNITNPDDALNSRRVASVANNLENFDDAILARLVRNGEGNALGYTEETRALIARRLADMNPELRTELVGFINNLSDPSRQTRYMSLLLNSQNPRQTLSRLKRLESGNTPVDDLIGEIDDQVNVLTQRISTAASRQLSEGSILQLTRQRSQLLQERFLLEAGDDIEVTRLFSSDAHNAGIVANDPTRIGHSLDNSFNLDLRVKEGRSLNLCRGSYGSRGGLSAVTGGFLTLCRDQDYVNREVLTEVLAAPTDTSNAFPGYQRFNRFELPENSEISFGLNGPVRYADGSGGLGGGIEFFTSRLGGAPTVNELRASVRVPSCKRSTGDCGDIFSTQADIRAGRLEGLTLAQTRAELTRAASRTDGLIESNFDAQRISEVLARQSDPNQAVNEILNTNPELTSALNLRREIELKQNIDFSNPNPLSRIDSDTLELNRLAGEAKAARGVANREMTTEQLGSEFRNFLTETRPELIGQFNQRQERINELVTSLRSATDQDSQISTLQQINNLRSEQSDVMIAIKGAEDAFIRPTSHLGSDRGNITSRILDELLLD